jgi:ubiquitin-conjugating enzyme E2 O
LDGTVEVKHPDSSRATYPLERLTKLYDGIEQLDDDLWGDDDNADTQELDENEPIWVKDDNGVWHLQSMQDFDEWEETDGDDDDNAMDVDEPGWASEPLPPSDDIPALLSAPRPDIPQGIDYTDSALQPQAAPVPTIPTFTEYPKDVHDDEGSDESNEGIPWKRFDVLPSAPADHAFYTSAPAQPSKSFLGRLTREYRVLANSLPRASRFHLYDHVDGHGH